MLRLLKLELQKLLLNRASKVLIFSSFILPFFVIILSSLRINFFGIFVLELGHYVIFNFHPLIQKNRILPEINAFHLKNNQFIYQFL